MIKKLISGLGLLVFTSSSFPKDGFEGRPITNNTWMPTGYTLHRGEFAIGIGPIGFGITDHVQVGTNILLYLSEAPNGNLKISLIKSSTSAFGVGIDLRHFNLDVFKDERSFTALSPFLAVSNKIGENTLLHLSGQLSFFSSDSDIDDADAESSSSGTSVFAGLEYSFSKKTKFLADVGYDITFEGLRLGGGVLFGWEKFRLKLGGGYFAPEGNDHFTLLVIGLWWRFLG